MAQPLRRHTIVGATPSTLTAYNINKVKMAFVFDLFRKKKETSNTTLHSSATSLNETIDHDGFIVYGEPKVKNGKFRMILIEF